MTMRHVCSWQHQSISVKKMDIEEIPHEVYFLWGKNKSLGKKMPLPRLLRVCCPNWASRTQKKVTAKYCQDKEGQPFRMSCFTESSVGYARPVGQRWIPQCCRGSLGDCPGSQLFLPLHVLEVACLHFLLNQYYFLLGVSEVAED